MTKTQFTIFAALVLIVVAIVMRPTPARYVRFDPDLPLVLDTATGKVCSVSPGGFKAYARCPGVIPQQIPAQP
jgi:hypothetical protein